MKRRLVWLLVASGIAASVAGCKSRNRVEQPRTIDGTVEKIDFDRKRVSFRFYHPKIKQEITKEVAVGDEVEIMIDGRVSSVKDVKEGDSAQVTYRPVRDKPDEFDILRVTIKRISPDDVSPPGAPSSRPADQ